MKRLALVVIVAALATAGLNYGLLAQDKAAPAAKDGLTITMGEKGLASLKFGGQAYLYTTDTASSNGCLFGCVEFDGISGTTGKYDLDFYLANEDWSWKVSKLLIHKVDGRARFHYDSEHQIVALQEAASAASAAAGAVPKPTAPARLQATVQGSNLELTVVEFQLLSFLSANPQRIYNRNQLMDHIYPDQRVVSDRTIDSHIKNLRKKLGARGGMICTVPKLGYRLEA